MKDLTHRHPGHPILPLLQNRWSPRSMTGEEISEEELMSLFEAARWAPSSYNAQPWRLIYARRDTSHWRKLFDLMVEFNQSWAKDAAVLLVVISRKTFEHNEKPSHTHSFDTGAAWMSLALEASSRGLVAHGMEGFNYEKARKDLHIPDNFQVEAMVAIGKRAPKDHLPPDLRAKEEPSSRKPLGQILMEGTFTS
jgi:nitroreductase